MGAMFDAMKMKDGRSAGDLLRERARNSLSSANPQGGMLGVGLRLANRNNMLPRPPESTQPIGPAQPAQPTSSRQDSQLGAMFTSKPDRAMSGSGRQASKGWWP